MAKIALAATPRALLDLYCLAPGQAQKPHTHGDQDKIYLVLEGRGRIHLDGQDEAVGPGEVVVAAGAAHGVVNDGTDPSSSSWSSRRRRRTREPAAPRRADGHLPGRHVLSRGRGEHRAPAAPARRRRGLPRRADVLWPAPLQLGLPPRGGRRGPPHRRPVREREHVVVPSGSCAWMVKHEYPGSHARCREPRGRRAPGRADLRAVAVPRPRARAHGSSGARSRAG